MPTFDNPGEAIQYLADQLGQTNMRLLKVEGENLALKAVLRLLHATISAEDRAVLAERGVDLADQIQGMAESSNDDTRHIIAAYVETLNSLLLPSGAEPEKPAFSVIPGGKGNSE